MHPETGIAIGRVLRPWGRGGAVVVEPLTHNPRRFERLLEVWVSGADGAAALHGVERVRFDGRGRPLLELSSC